MHAKGIEVEYSVDFELVGFNDEVVGGKHTLIDSISHHDVSLVNGELSELIMGGIELDVMLAEDAIRSYLTRIIGVDCLDDYAVWSALNREDDGMYRLGNISISIGDATARLLTAN